MKKPQFTQKLENYKKALESLTEAVEAFGEKQEDRVIRAGLIQNFEFCMELAWKLLKFKLESEGESESFSPKSALRKAYELGFLEDGELWLKMLSDRNDSSHNYDEAQAKLLAEAILVTYQKALNSLYERFGD